MLMDTQGCSRATPAPEAELLYFPHPSPEMLRDAQGCSRANPAPEAEPFHLPHPCAGSLRDCSWPNPTHIPPSPCWFGGQPLLPAPAQPPPVPPSPLLSPALLTPSSCRRRRGTGCCRGSPRPHGSHWLRSRCCAPTHSCCSTRTSAPQRASWSPRAWGWAAPPPP